MNEELKKTLEECGFNELLEMQKKVIPAIERGKDLFIQAETGSGKTLAYLIPVLEKTDPVSLTTNALIIAPTRELALQIYETASMISSRTGHHLILCMGGTKIQTQVNALKNRPQILIGTPGRFNDLLERDLIDLSTVTMTVLDEADQIISTGQREETENLLNRIPNSQIVCLSATKDENSDYFFLRSHEEMIFSKNEISSGIESFYVLSKDKKREVLRLGKQLPITTAILFTNYKNDANILAEYFQKHHILCEAFSSYFEERKRIQILKRFKNGETRLLIATDAAARGLDITDVSHIFHYDVPLNIETYIHRSGRTAHQSNTGMSITLLRKEETDSEVGKYILENSKNLVLNDSAHTDLSIPFQKAEIKRAAVTQLYIRAGRRDKLRPKDIIGALCTIMEFNDIGVLEIQEDHSTVTIKKEDPALLEQLNALPIKGKIRKIEIKH